LIYKRGAFGVWAEGVIRTRVKNLYPWVGLQSLNYSQLYLPNPTRGAAIDILDSQQGKEWSKIVHNFLLPLFETEIYRVDCGKWSGNKVCIDDSLGSLPIARKYYSLAMAMLFYDAKEERAISLHCIRVNEVASHNSVINSYWIATYPSGK
jgi:hypothetical protein